MRRELILFVPGLSAAAPAKYNSSLQTNLERRASEHNGEFRTAAENSGGTQPEGAAGGAIVFEHTPAAEDGATKPETKQIVLREVVWGDIPKRLSEMNAWAKFKEGTVLLIWAIYALVTKGRAVAANKYQWAMLISALLIMVLWYAGVIVAVSTALEFSLPFPDEFKSTVQDSLGTAATWIQNVSVGGIKLWAWTSVLLLIFPVTALVDSASSLKQYLWDNASDGSSDLVGEASRARISNALKVVYREQTAEGGPTFARITILTHSSGIAPALEALAEFGSGLRAPVRVVSMGAPLAFVGALRPAFETLAQGFAMEGRSTRKTELHEWKCVWSRWDYIASDPSRLVPAGSAPWKGFRPIPIDGNSGLWLFNDHGWYFHANPVADILLEPLPAIG